MVLVRLFFVAVLLALSVLATSKTGFAQSAVADPPKSKASSTESEKKSDNVKDAEAKAVVQAEPLYVRVKQQDKKVNGRTVQKPLALQTAIVRYTGAPGTKYDGRIVDLVGVVHIGQLEYYKKLNNKLATYQKVLYELVAPDGTRIRPEDLEKRRSILASMQSGMKDMLNLEYQLERIDYMANNFRHADMNPEEFTEDFARRGDSVWKMVARMMGAGLASQSASGGDAGMLMAMFSTDRSKKMKQVMARQLVDIETVTAGMSDENGEDTLIKGRNAKAFRILRDELDKDTKTIAVFYGAGHLPDMAKRLETEFNMKVGETTWYDAWDLTRN